jgi:hypothetical protein
VFASRSRALSRATSSPAVAVLIVGLLAVLEPSSHAAARPAGAAHAARLPPHIFAANANAGTPDGITSSVADVFIARATTARLTTIEGYKLRPGEPCGRVPTKRFATSGPLPLINVGGTEWQFNSTLMRAYRPVSAEALRIKLYVHACNRWGCSSRVVTVDRTGPHQVVDGAPPGTPCRPKHR